MITNEPSQEIARSSMPELMSGLISDAKELAVGHFGKMRGEIADEFKGLKRFLARVAIGVGVGVGGALLLAHTFALGIAALGVPLWAGYLIAAVLLLVVGAVVLKRLPADRTDIDLVPESTFADLKRDAGDVKREAQTDAREAMHAH